MPQIICPQCGTVNDSRAADYPFCVECQNNLAKCGYCRWFDPSTGVCAHPVVAGVFEVSEDATPPCIYHTPNERVLVRRRVAYLLIGILFVLVVGALIYGIMRMEEPQAVEPGPAISRLDLAVEADYKGAVVGKPYMVTALIYNTSNVSAEGVRLEIARASLEHLHLVEAKPKPLERTERGLWEMLYYPALDVGEHIAINLSLLPNKAGTVHLTVRLVSGNNVYHGMTDLPIAVAEPPDAETSGSEGERKESQP